MITLTDKIKCTGCTACEQICPVGAISMEQDKEGFFAPFIDDKICISCKKCISICPAENPPEKVEPLVYGARAKDEEIVLQSSSGGVFSLLAKRIIEESGIVWGAGFDDDFNVVHKFIDKAEDISLLTVSKYVQSQVGSSYKEVLKELLTGRKVMFVGTPCQCAGLHAFLGKEYENLIMVDFVCHGVPSPKLYKKYLEEISGGKKIIRVNFRQKTKGADGYVMGLDLADSTVYRSPVAQDPYMLAYAQDITLRKSCYACFSKDLHSVADLTLGDFWGLDETDSPLADKQGVSLVMANTDKGKKVFYDISGGLETDCRTLDEASRRNPCIVASVKRNPLRDKYLRDMDRLDIKKLTDKYCGSSYAAKFRRLIARCRKDR